MGNKPGRSMKPNGDGIDWTKEFQKYKNDFDWKENCFTLIWWIMLFVLPLFQIVVSCVTSILTLYLNEEQTKLMVYSLAAWGGLLEVLSATHLFFSNKKDDYRILSALARQFAAKFERKVPPDGDAALILEEELLALDDMLKEKIAVTMQEKVNQLLAPKPGA